MTAAEKKSPEMRADEALEREVMESGAGFLERPYSRYRFHAGYLTGYREAMESVEKIVCRPMGSNADKVRDLYDLIEQIKGGS